MSRTPGVLAALVVSGALIVLAATPAAAHGGLVTADPAPDATLSRAPTAVTLTFGGVLKPDLVTVVLTGPTRRRVATGFPVTDGPRVRITVDTPLGNGRHTVAYRAVTTDGHSNQGSYTFTVADPALPAPRVPAPSPSSASSAPAAHGSRALLAIPAVGVPALLITAGYLVMVHRRRRLRQSS